MTALSERCRAALEDAAPRVTLRQLRLLLSSVVPGLGHWLVLRDRLIGRTMLIASLAALAIALVSYRTYLADTLVYAVAALSAYSVYAAACALWERGMSEVASRSFRLGVALMVVAAYVGGYAALRWAASPAVVVLRLRLNAPVAGLAPRDTVLVWRRMREISRGDIVVANLSDYFARTVGPVWGLPGDRIEVRDKVFVNGVPIGGVLPTQPYAGQEAWQPGGGEYVLKRDEYWVMPAEYHMHGYGQMPVNAGVVTRSAIMGRVIAIVGPPSHRRRF